MFVSALAEERNRGRIGDFLLNDVMESLIQPLKLPLVFLAALVPCGHGCMGFWDRPENAPLTCPLVPFANHRPSSSTRGVVVQSQR